MSEHSEATKSSRSGKVTKADSPVQVGPGLQTQFQEDGPTKREFEIVQETISRRIFTVAAETHSDAVRRWLLGEGEISRKETDDWKLYAVEVESSPFDGVPGTASAAGGSWGNG